MQDEVYENAEMCDQSTKHGRAITHFCVARQQGVNKMLSRYTPSVLQYSKPPSQLMQTRLLALFYENALTLQEMVLPGVGGHYKF
jgi:hypothetical protein